MHLHTFRWTTLPFYEFLFRHILKRVEPLNHKYTIIKVLQMLEMILASYMDTWVCINAVNKIESLLIQSLKPA